MTDATCGVCCEDNCKYIVKCGCEFQACRKCAQRFLLESVHETSCMNCKKVWDRGFLCASFSKKWINQDYKCHRENILFERERGMMPATQLYITWLDGKDELDLQIKEVQIEIQRIYTEIYELGVPFKLQPHRKSYKHCKKHMPEEVYRQSKVLKTLYKEVYSESQTLVARRADWLRNNPLRIDRQNPKKDTQASLIGPCPVDDCMGFICRDNWSCGTCHTIICRHCHVPFANGHECKDEDRLTTEMIMKESKPCPSCAIPTFRISGCAQMWCTQCHTAWDWNTRQVDKGNIHNPHYFEWLRKTNSEVPTPNELNQEAMPHMITIRMALDQIDVSRNSALYLDIEELVRRTYHVWNVDRRKYVVPNNMDDNLDLRIQFMRKQINLDWFKMQLQRKEKKRAKFTGYNEVLQVFYNGSVYITHQMLHAKDKERVEQLFAEWLDIIRVANSSFETIAKKYDAVPPMI